MVLVVVLETQLEHLGNCIHSSVLGTLIKTRNKAIDFIYLNGA